MKSRILTVAALAVIVFSCAAKKDAPKVVETAEPVKMIELTPAVATGQNLYDNNCGKCHKLFKATDFTKEDWKPILVRMQKKAHLDDAQMASVSDYITSQL
ncbi:MULTISPECIES: cytochrome c [unclassified Flavobacterium]|jgi:cytochrome c5|uniref:c-type cytochrome n=1 Tax=unclassified Flavobacterium TaxID=196869 RepID=UPI00057C6A7E|nr:MULTISPECIES: cytochrome c [unclassified Flavobacterium]KIA94660.1 cytochrome C [Flavobacterium sp. KMS]MEA9414971.1 cytochrome c [Flavobacterium sp. PL02]OUL61136.1 cytochrome C [Flavobacterium sp. AJR]